MEQVAQKPSLLCMIKFLEVGDPFKENEFQLVKKGMPVDKVGISLENYKMGDWLLLIVT